MRFAAITQLHEKRNKYFCETYKTPIQLDRVITAKLKI